MTAIAAFAKDGVGILVTDTCGSIGGIKKNGLKKVVFSDNCIIAFAGSFLPELLSLGQKIADKQINEPSDSAESIVKELQKEISKNIKDLKNEVEFIVLYKGNIACTVSSHFDGFIVPSTESASIGNGGRTLQTGIESALKFNNINDYNSITIEDLKRLGKNALESVVKTNNFVNDSCYVYKQTFTNNTTFTVEGIIDETVYQTLEFAKADIQPKEIKAIVATSKVGIDDWHLPEEYLNDIANAINNNPVPMVLLNCDANGVETHCEGKIVNQVGEWTSAKVLKPKNSDVALLKATGLTTEYDVGYNYGASITLDVSEASFDGKNKVVKKAKIQDIALTRTPLDSACIMLQAYADGGEISTINDCKIIINDLTNKDDMSENTQIQATAASVQDALEQADIAKIKDDIQYPSKWAATDDARLGLVVKFLITSIKNNNLMQARECFQVLLMERFTKETTEELFNILTNQSNQTSLQASAAVAETTQVTQDPEPTPAPEPVVQDETVNELLKTVEELSAELIKQKDENVQLKKLYEEIKK